MTHNNYFKSGLTALVFSAAIAFAPGSSATLAPYSQDFEDMTPGQGYPPNDLEADGWRIYGIAYETDPNLGPANIAYQYGPFDAANGPPGSIQDVRYGEGGEAQGEVVMGKYTDYNNSDHTVVPFTPGDPKYYISASTFQTQIISTSNVGLWRFTYDAKIGNLEADSSASAFIQTLDPAGSGTAFVFNDTTNLPVEWGTYTLDFLITDSLIGDTLQFGFIATATNYNGSGVFYDNLSFERVEVIPVPAAVWLFGSGLLGLVGVARRRKH